jgi:hypothetical protein
MSFDRGEQRRGQEGGVLITTTRELGILNWETQVL